MRIRSAIVAAVLALLPGRAAADYAFTFYDPNTSTFTNSFTVAQGATVNVQVYLAQTNGSTGLTSVGLSAGGVALSYDPTVATVANQAAITPNSAFDTAQTSVVIQPDPMGTASLSEQQVFSASVFAPTTGTTAGAVLLGTFTFTGVSAGSTLTLTAEAHSGFDNNVLGDHTVLDSMIANSSATITTTSAVPEPDTLLLGSLLAAGLGAGVVLRRRWSRKQGQLAIAAG